MIHLKDRKFRTPRIWSNKELKKFSHLFKGKVINVSAWRDEDKEGIKYRDYFSNASEYWISNYKNEFRGFQGNLKNEIFLDLTKPLSPYLIEKFDVVFNHTTLEHIFDVFTAFKNLCTLSKDIVIVVVPFIQEQHADYGDYWRFTPLAIIKLFEKEGLSPVYINFNDNSKNSIYIFAIASKQAEKWQFMVIHKDNKLLHIKEGKFVGTKIIRNSLLYKLYIRLTIIKSKIMSKILKQTKQK